ncbi:MAG: hypothetical protein K9M45_03575 [Kiritimatiellales bacterium]|nr:hypothetical protein [Kiritimatiellales bacterium]
MNPTIKKLPLLLFLVVAAFFAANPFSLLDFPLDDAWIHRVYSRSFAAGQGFAYNPGVQEAGSTSPLWSIITAPVHWLQPLGNDAVVLAVKLIGIILALMSIHLVKKLGKSINGAETAGVIAASLFAIDPRLAFSALSGMETSLLVTLWLGAALAFIKNRPVLSAVLISLTPVTRPESLLLLPLFGIAAGIAVYLKKWRPRQLATLLILPIPMILWSLFCKTANGHWLPTTFYMKATSLQLGTVQLLAFWNSLSFQGLVPVYILAAVLTLLFINILMTHRTRNTWPFTIFMLAAPAAFLAGVACSREIEFSGYYWTRWFDPASLILTASFSIGIGMLTCGAANLIPGKKAPLALKAFIILALVISLPNFVNSFADRRGHLISDSRAIRLVNVRAGEWISINTPKDAVIGANDAGAIRYFGNRYTLDMMGLNNAELAFSKDSKAAFQKMDWLVIFPSWFEGSSIFQTLEKVGSFAIPPEEYTLTTNKGQAQLVVYRRLKKEMAP